MLFDEYLGLPFLGYLGWQAYLDMLMWGEEDPDPPDGGIRQTIGRHLVSAFLVLFRLLKNATMRGTRLIHV